MNIENIVIEELEGEQKEIAECVGIESYRNLVKNFGGTSIYIIKLDKISLSVRDEEIRKQFNGYNYKTLARKFNLSESRIRRIINNQP